MILKSKNRVVGIKCHVICSMLRGHDSVIPLINALGKRRFNGYKIEECCDSKGIQSRSMRGNIKDIVEKFYDHPAITHEEYAKGLSNSCWLDKPMI